MTTVSTGTPEPAAIGASDQDLTAGQDVGEYRIENAIGKGGFGTVYGAVHPLIGKRVAIKVLARKFSADPEIVSRFVAEARAVNQIRHRNIIDIFSFGQLADGRHYYVMEYLDGEGLDRHLKTHGAMPLAEAVPILRAIARALDAAHAKGIAHRDLKPENIFLARDTDGEVFPKLLDFGIAKLLTPEDDVVHRTGTGVPLGTPYYMSPEQCRGRGVDHRTDIYSFGIVAYRVLTGTFPFEGDGYMDLMLKQTQEEPPLPSSRNPALPATVDEAIAWMMQKNPDRRPPRVLEGVNALDPDAFVTPSRITRPSQPSSPPEVGITDPLAATITPETLPPRVAAQRGVRFGIAAAILVVGASVGTYAYINRATDKPTPSAPGPAVEPPHVVVPEATPPSVDAAAAEKIIVKTPPPDAAVPSVKKRPVRPPPAPTGKGESEPPKGEETKGDMIHLPSGTFEGGK